MNTSYARIDRRIQNPNQELAVCKLWQLNFLHFKDVDSQLGPCSRRFPENHHAGFYHGDRADKVLNFHTNFNRYRIMWRLRAVIMSHAVVHVAGGVRCDMHPPDPPGPSHPGHGFSVQPCNMNVSEQLWVLSPGRAACVKLSCHA